MGRIATALLALALTGCGQGAVPPPDPATGVLRSAARAAGTDSARAVPGATVVAVGDIACAPGAATTRTSCRQAATARLAARLDPQAVLALGDLQYERGTLRAFRRSYDRSWGTLKGVTLPVPGNHEYASSGAAGYYGYFGLTAPGYRAVTVGTWRVYLLNSNCAHVDCAAERAWLRDDLAANPVACSAIVMHHPRFSSGSEHGSDPSLSRFWRVADRRGVDLALAGHEHSYERFAPMDADGHRVAGGIRSFVVGTGGKSLYRKGAVVPGSRYFRSDAFGVLRLRLGEGELGWGFHTLGGRVRDAGRASCR